MIDRQNFKNFIDDTVITYKNSISNHDLHVDPYGNFEVIFEQIEYKARSQHTILGNGENFANSPRIETYGDGLGKLLFDKNTKLHKFIKSINDVELNINAKTLDMPGASYALHRLMPMNSQSNIQMYWLNTREPFIENVFIPWMKDNTINGEFPLVKCNLKISFPLMSNIIGYSAFSKKPQSTNRIIYKYYGIRPIEVGLHKMTNEPLTDFYRKVAFDFDYFIIDSEIVEKINNNQPAEPQKSSAELDTEFNELLKNLGK